jgi:penicillin-binding protein 1C
MRLHHWFVLPPAQEFYWRQHNLDYKSLPLWREDCQQNALTYDDDQPIDIVYPYKTSRIYIPMDIDGRLGRVIVKAVHRDPKAVLYWHLDEQYLGETRLFHDKTLFLEPGRHRITLVDKAGHQFSQTINVLSQKK